jgi:ribosome-associated translation inhibitor RaiA
MINRFSIHGITSDTLRTHVTDRLSAALQLHEPSVTSIVVTFHDENGPKTGNNDKRINVVVHLRGGGDVIVDERGDDAYAVVTTGAERVKQAINRKLERKHDKHHGAAAAPHHGLEDVTSV